MLDTTGERKNILGAQNRIFFIYINNLQMQSWVENLIGDLFSL